MANKFQKSVLERLEQEAIRQKQRPKEIEVEPEVESVPSVTAFTSKPEKSIKDKPINISKEKGKIIPEKQPAKTKTVQIEKIKETPFISDIGDYLIREHQRLAKNKTFYLDGDVINAIKSAAKRQNVTDSKLVNDILRRVLGLK